LAGAHSAALEMFIFFKSKIAYGRNLKFLNLKIAIILQCLRDPLKSLKSFERANINNVS